MSKPFVPYLSLVCSCVKDSIKSSREGIFQVALEANLTVWNVDTNTKNSGPSLERMVRTICFSSFDLSISQALSCDSKSLNFVKKSWILSVSVYQSYHSPVIRYALLMSVDRVLGQIFMVSIGFQIKIWSLVSVSGYITTPIISMVKIAILVMPSLFVMSH